MLVPWPELKMLDRAASCRSSLLNFAIVLHSQDHISLYSFSTGSGYNTWHPVIDGKLFTDFPTRSILTGKFAKVPLIVGYVSLSYNTCSQRISISYSATSNETLSGGNDITSALQGFFPSLTTSAASDLISVSVRIHPCTHSFFICIFFCSNTLWQTLPRSPPFNSKQ